MSDPDEILGFWFGRPGDPHFGTRREVWFRPKTAFDEAIRTQFLDDYEAAVAGRYDHWCEASDSCLALILVLDQFPRNMFRDSSRAFAADGQALAFARHALDRGYPDARMLHEKQFFYLPFEHSEDLADQERAVALFRALEPFDGKERVLGIADRHREIIERFGRFPHRNELLGRESTEEELAFLKEPNSSFLRRPDDQEEEAARG